jgi:sporulation protein YlmC with PRC-barrel domain
MRFSELYRARVRGRDGKSIGRVREIHCRDGEVTHLGVGAGALLQRLAGGRKDRRIPWDSVLRIRRGEIVIDS